MDDYDIKNEYKLGDIFGNDGKYRERAIFCNEHNYRIVEITKEGDKERKFQIQQTPQPDITEILRTERARECFPVVNRGELWYARLTEAQKEELATWYQAWLDVTETKVKPETPSWI